MRLASRFGRYNSIRRERPLTDDELMQFVPSVFSACKTHRSLLSLLNLGLNCSSYFY